MIRLYLIRHGQTPGNKLQRYIGTTDEPLSTEGKEFLEKLTYPMPEALYVSPLCRCVETAGILFPGKSFHIIEELSECDFGEFENKNYKELSGNQDYQRWIDSNGTLPFPGGESREQFIRRSMEGFDRMMSDILKRSEKNTGIQNDTDPRYLNSDRGTEIPVVTIVHGGTIMAVMHALYEEKKDFYNWQVENGSGYLVSVSEKEWENGIELLKNAEKRSGR